MWAIAAFIKQANFGENCNAADLPGAYGFVTYLVEYSFTFTFASREFPALRIQYTLITAARGTRQTDGQTDGRTDRHRPSFYNAPYLR